MILIYPYSSGSWLNLKHILYLILKSRAPGWAQHHCGWGMGKSGRRDEARPVGLVRNLLNRKGWPDARSDDGRGLCAGRKSAGDILLLLLLLLL